MIVLILLVTIISIPTTISARCEETPLSLITKALDSTRAAMRVIENEWMIALYPLFLKSMTANEHSVDLAKHKFQAKILDAISGASKSETSCKDGVQTKFVASFMGSSVTAGHDSPFNESLVAHTQIYMDMALSPLGIKFEARNVAMGNNPCAPYDLCVATIAGQDADIIHWEQSYNCMNQAFKEIFEQTMRQSLFMKNRPIVVITDSATPNWRSPACENVVDTQKTLNRVESDLVKVWKKSKLDVILTSNQDETRNWGPVMDLVSQYTAVPVQFFRHTHYETYKCLGPYHRDWGCCSASWHPSRSGHKLRGAHFSYFWLIILEAALEDLRGNFEKKDDLTSLINIVEKKSQVGKFPNKAIVPSHYSDAMSCYTDYEPRSERESNLSSRVLHWGDHNQPWKTAIIDALKHPDAPKRHMEKGYKDFKHVLYGNMNNGPISLHIHVKKEGVVLVCQPPGEWGKLPPNCQNFWDTGTEIYLTENINKSSDQLSNFVFDQNIAKKVEYHNDRPKDSQNVCVWIKDSIPLGHHALSIVPKSPSNVMIGVVLVP